MEHIHFLTKLGLSAHESVVYVALLEYGKMGVSEIARKTELHRTMIYEALLGLDREGLVGTELKGKYKIYVAESPKKLEAKFLELSNQFDEKINELSQIKRARTTLRPAIKYVEGRKGITAIYDDIVDTLKKGDVYYRYSSAKVNGVEKRDSYLSKKYRMLRDQKELERKVITNVANKEQKRPRVEREVKVVPSDFDLFEYNVSQVIYGNKFAVIDYNTETAVVVDDATIAKFQSKIFELLFRKL